MKTNFFFLPNVRACAAALLLALQSLTAQVSELVATDDAGGTQAAFAGGITSLDFFDNGLFWTVFGGDCSGEFTVHPSVATLGFRNSPFPTEHYNVRGCPPEKVGGAVRDDAFIFYTSPQGVQRKPIGANPADAARTIGLFWNNLMPGAMLLHNGRAYYAYSSPGGQISGGRGYFVIEYFDMPGHGGIFQPVTDVSNGSGLPNVGRIKKMGVVYRRVPDGSFDLTPYGLALTEQGYLLRFFLEQTTPLLRPAFVIATGVTDFAVRREQFPSPDPLRLFYEEDQLYVSVGMGRCPTDAPSRLITLDPVSLATSTVYTPPDGYISAIGLDQEYLFVSTFGRRSLGGPFGGCELSGDGRIRSKCSPARIFGTCRSGIDPNWFAIEPFFAGDNLRSDGRFLYFTRGKEVRRMPNNSPAVSHDFTALGFEAVQVIQDLNNSVRLVEGKRTILRAYARVGSSTIAQTEWHPSAQLRGWLNGVELPGPLFPMNSPVITATGDFKILRPDMNRSFQFELPAEWVRRGRLTLRFTVNPNLAIYESGGNPLANNSFEPGHLTVVQVQPPCFVFSTIHSTTAPNYWPWENADNFARIMERAKSMLPVPDIHIHPTTERVSDEHICLRVCTFLGVPYPCGFVCNDPFDLATKDGWDEAISELKSYDSFDQNRPGCGRTHYVGAVHPSVMSSFWAGFAPRPGSHLMAVMTPTPNTGINSAYGGVTIAHEFAHNLGRQHIDQTTSTLGCGGSQPAKPGYYPEDTCTLGPTNIDFRATPIGFDMIGFRPVLAHTAADLMSYANVTWPSIYTYHAMMDALGAAGPEFAAAGAPEAGPVMLVRGMLKLDLGTARLKSCYSLPDGVADPAKVQRSLNQAAAQGGHGYLIRKLDGGGATLEETPLVIEENEDADQTTVAIHQFFTKPEGMAALQIVKNGVVLAECRATPSPPVFHSVSAAYDPLGPSLQVAYDATDADLDPLLFSVQFSNDGGATWRTLRANEGSYTFNANPRFLPGGAQCRVRVIATDGFNSATITSDAFELPSHAPEPFIGGVRDGQRLPYGTSESLLGFALDAEDGSLPNAGLSWNLAGPTPRTGTGATLSLQGLSPGVYTATLNGADAGNNPGTATITFEVLPLVIADGAAPVMDGDVSDAAYASAPSASLFLSPKSKAFFTHAAGNLHGAFSDLPYGGPTLRGRVGLYIDVDGSGDGTAQTGDLAFFVNEDGVTEQYQGDGTQMQLVANPSSGFKAVITRGQGGWNVEFRIADSLVGGWNHAARIGVFDQSAITTFVFGIPIDSPLFAWWPASMAANNPGTWAPAWFGNVLPALVNLPPVAKAEAPHIVDASGSTTVALNGSASFDPEGVALSYIWTQLEGPTVSLNNAATAAPFFVAEVSAATTFRFQLVVNDGEFDSAPAEVEVILTPVTAQQVTLPPAATRQEDGSVTVGLQWPGHAGDTAIIQASTDLESWEDIGAAVVNSVQAVLFTDAQAGVYPHRFYRLASAPSQPVSAAGSALQFDGANDVVEVPHDSSLNAFPLTITTWIKTSQTTGSYPGIVTKYEGGVAQGYAIGLDQGRISCWYYADGANYLWDGGVGAGTRFIADGAWHHVAYVVDTDGGRVYVDGSLANTHAWVGAPAPVTSSVPLRFGVYLGGAGRYLNGQLDEVTLWNRALTSAEVNAAKNFKQTGLEPGLIGFWPFDEGAGETATDATGLGHDGVLQNAPQWPPSDAPIYP